jgi:hypothetical protein
MPVSSRKNELLSYLKPFQLGSGRHPDLGEMKRLESLIRDLAGENPTPNLESAFSRIAGMWKCIFTDSRFVLGLDRLLVVRLSGVYQSVTIHRDGKTGHYFNIAEMSRGGTVTGACGEYASIQPSGAEPGRVDVQYEWFYFAVRILSRYEGHTSLADRLESGRVPRRIRLPFHKVGWQSIMYLDNDLRIVRGSEGGLFVLASQLGASESNQCEFR